METTFIMVKPDGVQRGLVGEIMTRFERKGLKLTAAKLVHFTRGQAEIHYEEHKEKPFFSELVDFISSSPVLAMVWKGDDAIALARTIIGRTKASEAMPGTIRGDYALHTGLNLVHGSDSPESADRELRNVFSEQELLDYERTIQAWM